MRVLAAVHEENSGPGVFAEAAAERGAEIEEWQIASGAPPQDAPESYDAFLTLGGSMHVDQEDRHRWLRDEDALVRRLLAAGVPVFGVCLGAQIVAKALDAPVGPLPEAEIGWVDLALTAEAADDPIFRRFPERLTTFSWHRYHFALPAGAVPLARSSACLQAFRAGDAAWAIQFHPEGSTAALLRWIGKLGGDGEAAAEIERRIAGSVSLGKELFGRFLEVAVQRISMLT